MRKVMLKACWISDKKEIEELKEDSYVTFKYALRQAIFPEYKDKLKSMVEIF